MISSGLKETLKFQENLAAKYDTILTQYLFIAWEKGVTWLGWNYFYSKLHYVCFYRGILQNKGVVSEVMIVFSDTI